MTEGILLKSSSVNPMEQTENKYPQEQSLEANEEVEHELWSNQCDFFLSILGYAIDLANVWRFPYICFTNGGGAFLIPYFILMICTALPAFYLELILGQRHRHGAIALWDICPVFRGVGIAQVLISYMVAFYYNTVSAWSLYFLMASITDELPWTHCDSRRGNTPECVSYPEWINHSGTHFNSSWWRLQNRTLASTEYFERVALKLYRSPGLDNLGPMQWQMMVCTIIVFGVLFCFMRRGVKTSGKCSDLTDILFININNLQVVYVTALCPYLLLAVLLINGAMLKGAGEGIWYFIRPQFHRLGELKVWANAAIQNFFSTGAGFGVHIAFATYNPMRYNCHRDCIVTVAVNAMTSLFAGFTVFAYLGYLAHILQTPVETVSGDGPGLVFQIYPFAIGTLPVAPFWAFTFFLLLIMLGIDSGMGGLESVITGLNDMAPTKLKKRPGFRPFLTFLVVGSACLVALVNATCGGMYVFNLMDRYVAGASLLLGSLFQVIAISWFYGMDRLCQDIKEMRLPGPSIYWRLCWKFITPILLVVMVLSAILDPTPLQYNYGTRHPELLTNESQVVNVTIHGSTQVYNYPHWAVWFGWSLTMAPVIIIPIAAFVVIVQSGCHFTLKQVISLGPRDYWPVAQMRRMHETKISTHNFSANSKEDHSDAIAEGGHLESSIFA